MARAVGAEALYAVADAFRDECLLEQRSLITPPREIWGPDPVSELHRRIVQEPDFAGGVPFLAKLEGQLAGAPPEVVQLAAEILYIIDLPQDRDPAPRRQEVEKVLGLLADPPDLPSALVAALDGRIATYGQANIHKYWQFAFMVEFLTSWATMGRDDRQQLLSNPEGFEAVVRSLPQKGAPSQVEALLHVVFPDVYESIVSVDVKNKIAGAFAAQGDDQALPVDRRLADIRSRLTPEYGSSFSFYDSGLLNQWQSEPDNPALDNGSSAARVDAAAWLFQANLKAWDLRGALAALPTLQWVARQYRTQIKPDDSVHFWLSGPDGGVLGRGRVLTSPTEEPENPSDAKFELEGGFLEQEPRVWIAVERVLESPISRGELLENSELNDLPIFKFANATNFDIPPASNAALTAIENERPGRDLNREKLFFITASGGLAAEHLRTSLEEGVPIEKVAALTEISEQLERHAIDGRVYAWGARPGSAAEQKWERLEPGDVCLVYAKSGFPLWGRVYAKARSPEVARSIWGEHQGEIWECMYFLYPVEPLGASREAVVAQLKYKDNYIPQGFEIPGEATQGAIRQQYPTLIHLVNALRSGTTPRAARVWWVCQGTTYADARDLGVLWAPKAGKDGRDREYWRALDGVRVGDVVLHYATGSVRAVSDVTDESEEAPEPYGGAGDWSGEGRLVRANYRELETPIALEQIPVDWRVEQGAPFTKAGAVQQGYLFGLSDEFVNGLATRFPQLGLAEKEATMESPGVDYVPPPYDSILQQISAAGLRLDEQTIRRYHLSLRTRGFVVLSGLSGSGKTWLAQLYAHVVGAETHLVAVAPNWTANEDLLGYYDALAKEYRHTPFSSFLQAAAAEWHDAQRTKRQAQPYHLILDEMNLARVEYYFAKFLSAMEIRAREGQAPLELDATLATHLTPNLFFVGTVNVDETTHGFADKVYDRAQLIEIRVTRPEIEAHVAGKPYASALLDVWDAMRPAAPFAYRVLDEIAAYVDAAAELDVAMDTAIDEQVLQKVLPKLKGTEKAIGKALDNLVVRADGAWPRSHEKAVEMRDAFTNHGFTSYF